MKKKNEKKTRLLIIQITLLINLQSGWGDRPLAPLFSSCMIKAGDGWMVPHIPPQILTFR